VTVRIGLIGGGNEAKSVENKGVSHDRGLKEG
jgi:hypothetical protein